MGTLLQQSAALSESGAWILVVVVVSFSLPPSPLQHVPQLLLTFTKTAGDGVNSASGGGRKNISKKVRVLVLQPEWRHSDASMHAWELVKPSWWGHHLGKEGTVHLALYQGYSPEIVKVMTKWPPLGLARERSLPKVKQVFAGAPEPWCVN